MKYTIYPEIGKCMHIIDTNYPQIYLYMKNKCQQGSHMYLKGTSPNYLCLNMASFHSVTCVIKGHLMYILRLKGSIVDNNELLLCHSDQY